MKDPNLMLYGGLISVVSLLIGILLQYYLEREKVKLSFKHHPLMIVYNKQIEYIEKLYHILYEINIIVIKNEDNLNQNRKFDNEPIMNLIDKITDLTFTYYIFIPSNIYKATGKYVSVCYNVAEQIDKSVFVKYQQSFNELENKIRSYMGIEPLSKDIITAINLGHRKRNGGGK